MGSVPASLLGTKRWAALALGSAGAIVYVTGRIVWALLGLIAASSRASKR